MERASIAELFEPLCVRALDAEGQLESKAVRAGVSSCARRISDRPGSLCELELLGVDDRGLGHGENNVSIDQLGLVEDVVTPNRTGQGCVGGFGVPHLRGPRQRLADELDALALRTRPRAMKRRDVVERLQRHRLEIAIEREDLADQKRRREQRDRAHHEKERIDLEREPTHRIS